MCDTEDSCMNGGTCVDRSVDHTLELGEHICACDSLYGGTNCEERMCADDPQWTFRSAADQYGCNKYQAGRGSFHGYCGQDTGSDGRLAHDACPRACDVCGTKCVLRMSHGGDIRSLGDISFDLSACVK